MKQRDVITIINQSKLEYQATILAIGKDLLLVCPHNCVEPKCLYVPKTFVKEMDYENFIRCNFKRSACDRMCIYSNCYKE